MPTPGLSLRLLASPSRLPAGSQLFVWIDSMVSDHARAVADAAGWSGAVWRLDLWAMRARKALGHFEVWQTMRSAKTNAAPTSGVQSAANTSFGKR